MFWSSKKKEYTIEELKEKLKNLKSDEDKLYTNEYAWYYKNVPAKYFKKNGDFLVKRTKEILQKKADAKAASGE